MKLLGWVVAGLCAYACGGALADSAWFDAGISGYANWPASGEYEITGVGSWRGVSSAGFTGEALVPSGDDGMQLDFIPAVAVGLADGRAAGATVASQARFVAFTELPAVPSGAKGALVVLDEGGALAYYGLAKSGATNAWTRLSGTPATNVSVSTSISLKRVDGGAAVRYAAGGAALTSGAEEWLPVVADGSAIAARLDGFKKVKSLSATVDAPAATLTVPAKAHVDVAVSAAGLGPVGGSGGVYSFPRVAEATVAFAAAEGYRLDGGPATVSVVGDTRLAASAMPGVVCALSFPALEHMSVGSVSVGGEPVVPENGVYWVAEGALATVEFVPELGYSLDAASVELTVADNMVFPAASLPAATPSAFDPGTLKITEVMASNESGLVSPSGLANLDWVEIRNGGADPVDLSGWLMTDDPTKKKSKWKAIGGSAVVPAGGYLVVFADSGVVAWNDGLEAHVALGFSSAGEAVALATPDGEVVDSFAFGQQFKDVSYGVGSIHEAVGFSSTQYRVGDGGWKACAAGGLGMSAKSADGLFDVKVYKLRDGVSVSSNDMAEQYLATPSVWADGFPVAATASTLAYHNGSGGDAGAFGAFAEFPGIDPSQDVNNFIVEAHGVIDVPSAGSWNFGSDSDDGTRITLRRGGSEWSWEQAIGAGTTDFSLEAGAYDVTVRYFEGGGGAYMAFTCNGRSALVGSAASGLLHTGAHMVYAATDVTADLYGRDAPLTWRGVFDVAEAAPDGAYYLLRLRYGDGYAVRVNGEEVASAAAAGARTPAEMCEAVRVFIPASKVAVGANTLEVVGYNSGVGDREFVLAPELALVTPGAGRLYFTSPTPGADNDGGQTGLTPEVVFSEPHGYKTAPFQLEISCPEDPSAEIHYTTDGTSPAVSSAKYTGPIQVSATTVVRAAVPDSHSILQRDASATYLFLDDVLQQRRGVVPEGFPVGAGEDLSSWRARDEWNNPWYEYSNANRVWNGTWQRMRYGMLQSVVNGPERERLLRGFTNSIATISIVVDPKNMFDNSTGVYMNPGNDGRAWERQTMVEQIDPVNGAVNEFSVPAGIRVRGGASRDSARAKHSLRLFFRSEYGMSKLRFPLFGAEGADEFDKVDLRCSQNLSWAGECSAAENFVHEVFARDSQRDMGMPYTRSRYYNLFINGHYWGLYQTQERGDADFAESYLGGSSDDYDCIRSSGVDELTGAKAAAAVDGDMEAYEALWHLAVEEGFEGAHADNYKRAMGLDPDGTRNPAYPVYLNPTNLASFMMILHAMVNSDSPAHIGGHPNNLDVLRNRSDAADAANGFVWLCHDCETSMGFNWGWDDISSLYWGTELNTYANGREISAADMSKMKRYFSAGELNYRLLQNAEYRMLFADLFYKYFFNDGPMTVANAQARFRARMEEIADAIVCEEARWVRTTAENGTEGVYNRDTWLAACQQALDFIANRHPYLVAHYRQLGWYPSIDGPTIRNEADEPLGESATMNSTDKIVLRGHSDAIEAWYTLDGSDPRLEGGGLNPLAVRYTTRFAVGASDLGIRVRLRKDGEWSAIAACDVKAVTPEGENNAAYLRFAEFCGLPAASADGDSGEYIVLTNLSGSVALDLAGIGVIVKKDADTKATAKCAFTIASGTIPPAGSIRLDQADYAAAGWTKITNNKVDLYLIAADGVTEIQKAHATQKDHPTVYGAGGPGGGASLIADAFDVEIHGADWHASYELPAPAAGSNSVLNVIRAQPAVGLWLNGLVSGAAGAREQLAAYDGTEKELTDLYLAGYNAVVSGLPVRIALDAIKVEGGEVTIGGDLTVGGVSWGGTVNGAIKLYRYETLAAEPDVLELDATRFPLNGVLGDDSGTYRFFKIVLE